MRTITIKTNTRTFTLDKDGNVHASGKGRIPLAIKTRLEQRQEKRLVKAAEKKGAKA